MGSSDKKDIIEIIDKLKQSDYVLYILTNGVVLSNKIIKEMIQILNKKDVVQVSLDGATSHTNDFHRGEGTYKKIIKTIKKLVNEGLKVRVNMVVTKYNYKEIPKVYQLVNKLRCNSLSVIPVVPLGKGKENLFPPKEKLLQIEYEVLKKAQTLFTPHYFGILGGEVFNLIPMIDIPKKYLQENFNSSCDADKYKAHIAANGELYPCVFAQHPKFRIGNLLERSFAILWESKNWRVFREEIVNKKECRKCQYLSLCGGGCPGITYEFYGTIKRPDPRCQI